MRRIFRAGLVLPSFLICFHLAFSQEERNLLPKYGSLPKTEWQKQADDAFLRATDEEYHGDRKKASLDSAARGWQYLREGDLDMAMRRFNQAWLLDDHDGAALWGMAAVEASGGKIDDSLKLFAEAERYSSGDINFSIDFAKAMGIAALEKHDDKLLKDAFARFEQNQKKAPQNVLNLQNWATTLAGAGRYCEAWDKVKLAESMPNKSNLDPEFIAALQARMPRPKH
jgi:tetratricopeptide (TPR) repeat protein